MSENQLENKAVEIMRNLAEKIRHELLSPDLNIRNLCAQVEQMAAMAKADIDEARKHAA